MLYFAVEDGNDTTANVTLENGSVNQTILILSGLRKYTQYSIQILFFFFNFFVNIRLYLKRFYASEGWKNHGNRLNLFLLKSATQKLNQHANEYVRATL